LIINFAITCTLTGREMIGSRTTTAAITQLLP
jgi:hypothetical protein